MQGKKVVTPLFRVGEKGGSYKLRGISFCLMVRVPCISRRLSLGAGDSSRLLSPNFLVCVILLNVDYA